MGKEEIIQMKSSFKNLMFMTEATEMEKIKRTELKSNKNKEQKKIERKQKNEGTKCVCACVRA